MNYWKLRFVTAQREQQLRELTDAAKKINDEYAAVLRAEGLDPEKPYRMVDEDETITPIEPPAPEGGHA